MIRRDFRCPGPTPAAVPLPVVRASSGKPDLRRSLGRDGALHPLLGEIDAYQRAAHATGKPVSDCSLGHRATGDPNLVTGLRDGRWPRAATVARVLAWMAKEGVPA